MKAMETTILEMEIHEFLAQKRIAVADVSCDNSRHPAGNLAYRRLKGTEREAFPVTPHM
jgi:hypothetical protein